MSDVKQAIKELDEFFTRCVAAKDMATLVEKFYTEDAALMPPNHPAVEGRANIQPFLQGMIDSGISAIELELLQIESAGDLAFARGRYVLTITLPDGNTVQQRGKQLLTYRRQSDGSWRACVDMFSSDGQ